MNWIDYAIFSTIVFSALTGLASGPVLQSFKIVFLLISFLAAFFFHGILSAIISGIFPPSTTSLLSFFTIFGISFVVAFFFTDLIKHLTEKFGLGKKDFSTRLIAALLGACKGLFFCGVIIYGILLFCDKPTCDKVNTSKVATRIGKGMQKMVSVIPEGLSKNITDFARKGKEQRNTEKRKELNVPHKEKE
ncbi:MAG: CvpA family protein [Candidatus Brocadiaceae bacterium]|nr:CvpA family protein [Candidatus Brocadiaceae bacterium]